MLLPSISTCVIVSCIHLECVPFTFSVTCCIALEYINVCAFYIYKQASSGHLISLCFCVNSHFRAVPKLLLVSSTKHLNPSFRLSCAQYVCC